MYDSPYNVSLSGLVSDGTAVLNDDRLRFSQSSVRHLCGVSDTYITIVLDPLHTFHDPDRANNIKTVPLNFIDCPSEFYLLLIC